MPLSLRARLALLSPACLLLLAAFAVPIAILLLHSVLDPTLTGRHYVRLIASPLYLQVFLLSLRLSAITTVLALILGYPLAYVLALSRGGRRSLMLLLVLLPFWTNILVRCYAWILVLQVKGLVNLTLVDWLGLLPQPLPLVFNPAGAIIGLVHYLLPIAVLVLDSTMRGIDPRLTVAAASLGARPWKAFMFVFLPQTWVGLRAASLLLFISALGSFVIPALLGGQRGLTIAILINTEFSETMNWGFGSALATVLLVATLVMLASFHKLQPAKAHI